jgi:hypothetical protein
MISASAASLGADALRPSRKATIRLLTRADCPGWRKPIRQLFDCCALTERGHALPEPTTNFIKSRRLIADHTPDEVDPSVGNFRPRSKRPNVRSGSWLCENAKTPDGDRRSYSSKTVLALKRASVLNSESELKNVILTAFRSLAFSHSQGQKRRFDPLPATSGIPSETDIPSGSRHVSKVPTADMAPIIFASPEAWRPRARSR